MNSLFGDEAGNPSVTGYATSIVGKLECLI
jgi:hypothetical protein